MTDSGIQPAVTVVDTASVPAAARLLSTPHDQPIESQVEQAQQGTSVLNSPGLNAIYISSKNND